MGYTRVGDVLREVVAEELPLVEGVARFDDAVVRRPATFRPARRRSIR
ncbi:hypothetical protein [Kitasatospora sp. MAP5-34]|nr:hypothetical protein [Kitasatospora sp. MAP5-34]MDH6576084.1 hypothetical protein [Kitasatospora sp. MAP5-34]